MEAKIKSYLRQAAEAQMGHGGALVGGAYTGGYRHGKKYQGIRYCARYTYGKKTGAKRCGQYIDTSTYGNAPIGWIPDPAYGSGPQVAYVRPPRKPKGVQIPLGLAPQVVGTGFNPWVQFLKTREAQTGIPYNELMVNPRIRSEYASMKGSALVGGRNMY